MMKRRTNHRRDKKRFQKNVNTVHPKNLSTYYVPRGGYRL